MHSGSLGLRWSDSEMSPPSWEEIVGGSCSDAETVPEWLPEGSAFNACPEKPALVTYERRVGRKRKIFGQDNTNTSRTSLGNNVRARISPRKTLEDGSESSLSEPDEQTDGRDENSKVTKWETQFKMKSATAPHTKHDRGQYFLDFGQSDFSYSTCSVCGLLYARGQESDQKVHEKFHKNYLQGIQFKGWRNERVAARFEDKGSRIIVVLPEDPVQHQHKVKEVTAIMEKEMGVAPGWLIHSRCKIYLYAASRRLVGCAIVEPIKEAFPLLPESTSTSDSSEQKKVSERRKSLKKAMLFGNIKFVREVHRKAKSDMSTVDLRKAMVCGKDAVPAVCGVRGIWVLHSARRKGVGASLLDTIRKTFCLGSVVQRSQCAFSQPTPDGTAFASNYCKTNEFLVYC